MTQLSIVASYSAVGGPGKPRMGADRHMAGPTDAGEYLLQYCGQHKSSRYASWSGIPWGARLKEEDGELLVQSDGRWKRVKDVTGLSKKDIQDECQLIYGRSGLPTNWVFNDFGHMTCYLYRDVNRNKRLDPGKERIHSEFFHTTPVDEARTALGKPVHLTESHGCVHVKPADIDEMIKRGYMRKGNRVIVHQYSEIVPKFDQASRAASPYELHFYPKARLLVVLGHVK